MYVEERRLHILELLKKKRRVDVSDLADKLNTSPETIRRDLNEMEADGFLKRTHGGAIYRGEDTARPLIPVMGRRDINHEMKRSVARVAAFYVDDGDVIAIDNSTTACRILEFIPASYRLTVITYSLQVVMDMVSGGNGGWNCICLGGSVHNDNLSTHGILTTNALSLFQPHKLFMSCAGVGQDGLITEGALMETEIKRELILCCQKTFLLVDGTKWGQIGSVNEGTVDDLDFLITNAGVDPAKLAFLADRKVRVLFDDD